MVKISDVIAVVKKYVTATNEIHASFVPESVDESAIAVYNVTNSGDRAADGFYGNRASFWRLELLTTSTSDKESISEQIWGIDMVSSDAFQRVLVELVNEEPREVGSDWQRTFFDLTVYER